MSGELTFDQLNLSNKIDLVMKRLFMCCICLVTCWCAFSQQSYEEAMRQGDIAFKNGEYKTAINKYFAAKAYDPTKKELVKKRMDSVFNRIDKLRKEAEAAKKTSGT